MDKGDIFQVHHWPGANTYVGVWNLDISDATMGRRGRQHKIVFRHSLTIGNWILIIDGKCCAVGHESLMATTFSVTFLLDDVTYIIDSDIVPGVSGAYTLRSDDGNQYPEQRQVTTKSLGEAIPSSISVPTHRTFFENKKTTIIYQIYVKSGSGKDVIVERRFGQFDMLNSLLLGQLHAHMRASLPSLPSKVFNPFFDQTSPDFIAKRKEDLETYLNQLLGNSKVSLTTDFLCFLGLDPLTGEPLTNEKSGQFENGNV